MIRNKKAMLFCSQIILTGALMTGAPCLASGDTGENGIILQNTDKRKEVVVVEDNNTDKEKAIVELGNTGTTDKSENSSADIDRTDSADKDTETDEDASDSVFGSSDAATASDEVDHSGEGQIHKPSSLEAPDFTSDPDFVDDSTDNTYGYYTIMGDTTVSLAQMTSQYEEHGAEYPSASLKEGGAATIDDFCTIILEEANAEGVRGEVVFEQAMLETGWLQYGGDSGVSQFNFAGIGTTGGGVAGVSYPDVRTGIRAQVQHLKAYACEEDLNQDCVDTRFDMVTRGSAPYVEWLGQQENPNGGGWAAGSNYGEKLRKLLSDLKAE